jgi:hypothetical protein
MQGFFLVFIWIVWTEVALRLYPSGAGPPRSRLLAGSVDSAQALKSCFMIKRLSL